MVEDLSMRKYPTKACGNKWLSLLEGKKTDKKRGNHKKEELIQAGLSRATLEISSKLSSKLSSNFPLRTHKSHSTRFEVIFTPKVVFYWRSSSF